MSHTGVSLDSGPYEILVSELITSSRTNSVPLNWVGKLLKEPKWKLVENQAQKELDKDLDYNNFYQALGL